MPAFRRPVLPVYHAAASGDWVRVESVNESMTKPWTTSFPGKLATNTDVMEYVCVENEKSLQHRLGSRLFTSLLEARRS
jgi:hypothetical protein